MDFTRQEKAVLFILGASFTVFLLLVLLRMNIYSAPPGQAVPQPTGELVVQVQGAIASPGVYRVAQGTRLYELVDMAGGATGKAELHDLNMAAPLYDGQRVVIPSREDTPSNFTSNLPSFLPQDTTLPAHTFEQRININTASAQQLETLPGIGEVLAGRIVEYRQQKGAFSSPDDLLGVRGIGTKRLEEIRERITF